MCTNEELNIFYDSLGIRYEKSVIQNPLDDTETCCLLNTKRESYYTNTYDPIKFIENIKQLHSKYRPQITDGKKIAEFEEFFGEYYHNVSQLINMTPNDKCCNCVAFTLYINYDTEIDYNTNHVALGKVLDKLYGYLSSLQISILNIQKHLKKFISRLYVLCVIQKGTFPF
jgi:hypothetical protein